MNFNGQLTDIMIETSTFTASRGGIAENNWEAGLLVSGIHKLVCVHQVQTQQLLACIVTLLHLDDFVDTFRKYHCSLFTSGSHHEIFWQVSSIDIIPESSHWEFWNCIQRIVLFELLTKSLQNRRSECGKVRVQQSGLHFGTHLMDFPIPVLAKIALFSYVDSSTVC